LQTSATDKDIRTAYHVLVRVWHPDRLQHDPALKAQADEKLKEINSAFRYLTSHSAREEEREAAAATDSSEDETSPAEQPRRARTVSLGWIKVLKAIAFSPIVMTCAFFAAFAVIGWMLFVPIDKFLASEPLTAESYKQCKGEVRRGLWGAGATISGYASEMWHGHVPRQGSSPTATAALQHEPSEPAAQTQKRVKLQSNAEPTAAIRILPYVTAGLSKDEVIAVQGPPTSTSENELTYGSSELYFSGGGLVGWKLDSASPHIRVKLWPDAPVDPDLDTFWVGSSKNEVLAVQGTPTLWSENTFGYGRSEVYFENGRVVSWKNDPATVPLRAKRR
jgi:hypothetical protein